VTGTSSGIGRAAVAELAKRGCFVVATARKLADIEHWQLDNVQTMQLDVTHEASRQRAVATILAEHGRIDGLVNNAGFGIFLPVEETTVEHMQRMFDVNLFGAHALTRLVLPSMRARGFGRIVNVASVAGQLSFPMIGAYCASKFALRALTHALHMEVRQFGIHACLIEPGTIRTEFGKRAQSERTQHAPGRVHAGVTSGGAANAGVVNRSAGQVGGAGTSGADSATRTHEAYAELHAFWTQWRARHERGGASPQVIARRIAHACTARRPRFHYFAPLHAKAANVVRRIVPDAWFHRGARAYFRL
jgi:NAD(P)-dependent dehydrogenase (short-subunit alcohol dehydrogenase family)